MTRAALSTSDFVLIFTALGGLVAFIAVAMVFSWRAKTYLDEKFSEHRRFVYTQLQVRDRAILRLEFWAVAQKNGYQPGAEPRDSLMGKPINGG